MNYINGLWNEQGSHPFTSANPATGEIIWRGMAAGQQEVAESVAAARAAFPAWAKRSYEERHACAERFTQLIVKDKEALALAISRETGKAPWDARSEAAAVVAKLAYASEAYQERTGIKSITSPLGTAVLCHRPHGVMAVYGPYNFPAHLPNSHIMPALLAGNSIVFKPSEQTPMVAEWIVKKWQEAGLPAGVLNLIQGERATGELLADAAVDGILFTGSSTTGKAIHAQLAGRPEILLALEMGGNNPLIVSNVSDIPAAVYETIISAFSSTGQRCTCARRLILPAWAGREEFIRQLLRMTASLVIAAYDETPPPFMGPVISMHEAQRLLTAQEKLENIGGRVLTRMQSLRDNLPFLSPAIIDVTSISQIPDEEYFGPFLQLYRVESLAEAIAVANNTRFGLSAALFSDIQAEYQEVKDGISAGLLNWNRQTTGASGAAPFGGRGLSGNHRPAGYYAADYCAYPVASVEQGKLALPANPAPGISL